VRINPFFVLFVVSVLGLTQSLTFSLSLELLASFQAAFVLAALSIVFVLRPLVFIREKNFSTLFRWIWIVSPFCSALLEGPALPGGPYVPAALSLLGALCASQGMSRLTVSMTHGEIAWAEFVLSAFFFIILAFAPVLFCVLVPFYLISWFMLSKSSRTFASPRNV
jgi:hypothetical protein